MDRSSQKERDRSPTAEEPVDTGSLIPDVRYLIAVGSGKGGVGKSTIATNLAVALAADGADIGLVDADVYGPNAPRLLGLEDRTPATTLDDRMQPREAHGVKVMSMGFITEEDDPVIWRGPIVDEFVKQLFGDVEWGELDYLVVDLPPGTGDAHLSLVQHLPVTGAIVVTTPQPVAAEDARRSLEGFVGYGIPVLGIVENMAGFRCPDCDSDHAVFEGEGADRLAQEFGVPVLGRIPVDPSIADPDPPDDVDPPGVTVPLIGRIGLPRTAEEREGRDRPAPIAIRGDANGAGRSIRRLVDRTIDRVETIDSAAR